MSAPTVSYDVFDTVVTRAFAHPRDLFVWLGVELQRAGVPVSDPLALAQARWSAELAARRKSPWTEVLFDDIHRELAAQLSWDETTAATARHLELEIESRHLHGIPAMRSELAQARTQAGRLLFLSDMYLPPTVLRPWLEREGMVAPGDLLLVSGDVRGNKSSGQLFKIAQAQTGGDFAHWHHTGDHPFADVASPRRLGISATHFTSAHLTARERTARGSEGEFATPWRSLLAGAMRLARLEHRTADEREAVLWETGATVAGPLFYGFVRWTLAEARRRGLRRLYFLARDGQIFHRIAQAIQAVEPFGISCEYLHASRVLFSGPAEINSPAAVRAIVAPHAVFHSLRQCLLPLGLDEAWGAANLPPRFRSVDPAGRT
jgi:predicted HAD superfamily hydrolase